jgi:uncharacterized membrane protein HdeD (DUF308 family)
MLNKLLVWYSLFVGILLMYFGVTIGINTNDESVLWFTLLAILPLVWSSIKAVRSTL